MQICIINLFNVKKIFILFRLYYCDSFEEILFYDWTSHKCNIEQQSKLVRYIKTNLLEKRSFFRNNNIYKKMRNSRRRYMLLQQKEVHMWEEY